MLDRYNNNKNFLDETVQRTEDPADKITLSELYEEYTLYCKTLGIAPIKRSMFKDDVRNNLDETCYKERSNTSRDDNIEISNIFKVPLMFQGSFQVPLMFQGLPCPQE